MYRGKLQLLSGLAAIAVATQAGGAVAEQLPKREALLQWRGDAQVAGYRHIDRIFSTHIVRRGAKVRPLPVAAAAIRPAYRYGAESGSADDYMARNRTAGLLVIHKGRIVLEKYALGITPQDRWISFSIAKSLTSTLLGAAIADGKIGLVQAADIKQFVAGGVEMTDGTVRNADLVVLATGYKGQGHMVGTLFGNEVAERVGRIWGFEETTQELRNMWVRTKQPGLWFTGGAFSQCRIYSRYMALQIEAIDAGRLAKAA